MKRINNKKGETQVQIIMWIGVLIAISIVILWSIKNLQPRHIDLETVNYDLEEIQRHIHSACSSVKYTAKFNPGTIHGYLEINNSEVCIHNSFNKCRVSMCDIGDDVKIHFDNITYLIIEKDENGEFSFDTE